MNNTVFTKKTYKIDELLSQTIIKITNKNISNNKSNNLFHNLHMSMNQGELIVLASRPSIGRTMLTINWGLDLAANYNKPVGFITAGIHDSESLTFRLLAFQSKISPAKLRNSLLSEKDTKQIEYAATKLNSLPIFISDIPNAKFEDIETTANEMVNINKIEILFIDSFEYLYEITVSKTLCDDALWAEQMKSYYNEIYFIMENLKTLANKIHIPIVLLVPIKRDAYGEEPTIKSFEDKLIIPRIADKVIFLHRDRKNNTDEWQDAKLIIAKSEKGTCGDILIKFCCRTGEFIYDEK